MPSLAESSRGLSPCNWARRAAVFAAKPWISVQELVRGGLARPQGRDDGQEIGLLSNDDQALVPSYYPKIQSAGWLELDACPPTKRESPPSIANGAPNLPQFQHPSPPWHG
jgi:hypothetical protein